MRKGRFNTGSWWGDTVGLSLGVLALTLVVTGLFVLASSFRAYVPLGGLVTRPPMLFLIYACIVFYFQYRLALMNSRHGHSED